MAVPGDIGDEAQCRELVDQALQRFGRLDILVNNAAFQTTHETITDHPSEEIERIFRPTSCRCSGCARRRCRTCNRAPTIINAASIQAYQPAPMLLPYATTKGAIVTFTKGLAQDLTPKGIRVNAVAPGPVWTPLIPMSMPEEKTSEFGAETPLGRTAQPSELAPPYVFLASDESRYVSGDILAVTGGQITA